MWLAQSYSMGPRLLIGVSSEAFRLVLRSHCTSGSCGFKGPRSMPFQKVPFEMRNVVGQSIQDAGQPRLDGRFPVSRVCPGCQSGAFRSVRPRDFVAFGWDRVCKGCGTRYSPPTPRWAGFAFILMGIPLMAVGGFGVVVHLAKWNVANIPALTCEGLLGSLASWRSCEASRVF